MKAMKKMMTLVLAAGLFLSAINGFAAPKDSTWLSSESNMTSNIDKSTDGSPVGMVSIWATHDPIPDGWLECNGQTVNSTKYPEYVAKFGSKTPDYRGFFLRGFGGKSADLGVAQDYAVQTNGSNMIKIQGIGEAQVDYLTGLNYVAPTMPTLPDYSDAFDQLRNGVNLALKNSKNASSTVGGIKGDIDQIAREVLGSNAGVPMTFKQYVDKFYKGLSGSGVGSANLKYNNDVLGNSDLGSSGSNSVDNISYSIKGSDNGNTSKVVLDNMIDKYNDYLVGMGYGKMLTFSEYSGNKVTDTPNPDDMVISTNIRTYVDATNVAAGAGLRAVGNMLQMNGASSRDLTTGTTWLFEYPVANMKVKDFINGNFNCDFRPKSSSYVYDGYAFSNMSVSGNCRTEGSLATADFVRNGVADVATFNAGGDYKTKRETVLAKYNELKTNWGTSALGEAGMDEYNSYIYDFRPGVPMTFKQYVDKFYKGISGSGVGSANLKYNNDVLGNSDLGSSGSNSLDKITYSIKGADNGNTSKAVLDNMIDRYNDYLVGMGYGKMLTFSEYSGNKVTDTPRVCRH